VASEVQLELPLTQGIRTGQEYRHNKSGGLYYVICRALIEADLTPAVVYSSAKDGRIWVRPEAEFLDGRFTLIR
jgi:hypothetical protein